MRGQGPWLVVVSGPSKVGKSRTLFEAIRGVSEGGVSRPLRILAPIDTEAVRALLASDQSSRRNRAPTVLWLDDLEPFLNQGLSFQMLSQWHAGNPHRVVVATYGGKGSELVAGSSVAGLATIAAGVLQHAREIPLAATTADELAELFARLPASEISAIERHGLAAYLVAGRELERKLATARHAPNEAACPEGVAIVAAVIDWARCGRTDPIDDTVLRRLWPAYLPEGNPGTEEGFALGLVWALKPVAGSISLIRHAGSYLAYDYIVRLASDRPGAKAPREPVWVAAIESANDAQASAVALAAYQWSRLKDAASAFNRARQSTDSQIAARAGYNLGVVYGELGRWGDAVEASQRMIEDYGQDPAPALREQVANALVNKGFALGVLGRSDDAVEASQRVIEDYGQDPAPALRELVAKALRNKGVRLGVLGRSDDELAAYQRVIEDYGQDSAPALREIVARALEAFQETDTV